MIVELLPPPHLPIETSLAGPTEFLVRWKYSPVHFFNPSNILVQSPGCCYISTAPGIHWMWRIGFAPNIYLMLKFKLINYIGGRILFFFGLTKTTCLTIKIRNISWTSTFHINWLFLPYKTTKMNRMYFIEKTVQVTKLKKTFIFGNAPPAA